MSKVVNHDCLFGAHSQRTFITGSGLSSQVARAASGVKIHRQQASLPLDQTAPHKSHDPVVAPSLQDPRLAVAALDSSYLRASQSDLPSIGATVSSLFVSSIDFLFKEKQRKGPAQHQFNGSSIDLHNRPSILVRRAVDCFFFSLNVNGTFVEFRYYMSVDINIRFQSDAMVTCRNTA